MLITLSRLIAICQSIIEVYLTGLANFFKFELTGWRPSERPGRRWEDILEWILKKGVSTRKRVV